MNLDRNKNVYSGGSSGGKSSLKCLVGFGAISYLVKGLGWILGVAELIGCSGLGWFKEAKRWSMTARGRPNLTKAFLARSIMAKVFWGGSQR